MALGNLESLLIGEAIADIKLDAKSILAVFASLLKNESIVAERQKNNTFLHEFCQTIIDEVYKKMSEKRDASFEGEGKVEEKIPVLSPPQNHFIEESFSKLADDLIREVARKNNIQPQDFAENCELPEVVLANAFSSRCKKLKQHDAGEIEEQESENRLLARKCEASLQILEGFSLKKEEVNKNKILHWVLIEAKEQLALIHKIRDENAKKIKLQALHSVLSAISEGREVEPQEEKAQDEEEEKEQGGNNITSVLNSNRKNLSELFVLAVESFFQPNPEEKIIKLAEWGALRYRFAHNFAKFKAALDPVKSGQAGSSKLLPIDRQFIAGIEKLLKKVIKNKNSDDLIRLDGAIACLRSLRADKEQEAFVELDEKNLNLYVNVHIANAEKIPGSEALVAEMKFWLDLRKQQYSMEVFVEKCASDLLKLQSSDIGGRRVIFQEMYSRVSQWLEALDNSAKQKFCVNFVGLLSEDLGQIFFNLITPEFFLWLMEGYSREQLKDFRLDEKSYPLGAAFYSYTSKVQIADVSELAPPKLSFYVGCENELSIQGIAPFTTLSLVDQKLQNENLEINAALRKLKIARRACILSPQQECQCRKIERQLRCEADSKKFLRDEKQAEYLQELIKVAENTTQLLIAIKGKKPEEVAAVLTVKNKKTFINKGGDGGFWDAMQTYTKHMQELLTKGTHRKLGITMLVLASLFFLAVAVAIFAPYFGTAISGAIVIAQLVSALNWVVGCVATGLQGGIITAAAAASAAHFITNICFGMTAIYALGKAYFSFEQDKINSPYPPLAIELGFFKKQLQENPPKQNGISSVDDELIASPTNNNCD